ncbi:hypothetical protein F4777DRAFT_574621 [Nemania sp. FL0916]|nr:hypothetical protein F4777DRAFT_574621 [Nemania sp. FL0916]
MKAAHLRRTVVVSALVGAVGVGAVPMGGTLGKLNAEACGRAMACGHSMDCNELWVSCNLKLLLAGKGGAEFSDDGEHPALGYMVPWWYQGMGMTM